MYYLWGPIKGPSFSTAFSKAGLSIAAVIALLAATYYFMVKV